jgi:hypothetical protein
MVFALCSLLLAPCSAVAGQQAGKIPRIGFLHSSTASGSAVLVDAFRQELSKLGWIEGKNITIEYRGVFDVRADEPGSLQDVAQRPTWSVSI